MKAHHQTLLISLIDDCVFSERAATEGAHGTLDRIPGAALLGAAASRLYASLSIDAADAAFHSGRLRFCDGLPADKQLSTWPVPMCWHYAKSMKPQGDFLVPQDVHNFLHVDDIPKADPTQGNEQAKPLREGYVSQSGRWIKPKRNYRMKTAIAPETGRAADAQLFGYTALERGQTFIARIEADADFDAQLFSRVAKVLEGQLLLGRSRSAEYGRVQIEHAPGAVRPKHGSVTGRNLTLWLLSDLAPCDANGQATLNLDVQALGLPHGSRVEWGKTFVRARRYSPWNSKRHGYETERQVLVAGGIITITLPADADSEVCMAQLQRGIGLHREAGLGQVWINPPLLATANPQFDPRSSAPPKEIMKAPSHPLVDWLKTKTGATQDDTENKANDIVRDYQEAIESARRVQGYPEFVTDFYPSRSQWGSVLEVARVKQGKKLFHALFHERDGVIRPNGKGWDSEIPPNSERGPWSKLADWLKLRISQDQQCDAHLVQQIARRLMDQSAKRKV
ncbi:hypothetical protein [Ferrovum sp.]|uniref:hypothetical protein n=1 Tax=Ferrovum sp. TaxID=2609467 RepID=UPI0026134C07|nr:hypothetical protein [Ferrovum sp.]